MKTLNPNKLVEFAFLLAVWTLILVWQVPAWAASHSDAPLIKQDPQANITDVYAFIGTKYNDPNQNVLNVVVQVRPFSEPGEAVFAGPREDGFFADIPGIFDLLNDRILGLDGLGQSGDGVDGFKGYNVLAFAIQIPVASLPSFLYTAPFADFGRGGPAVNWSIQWRGGLRHCQPPAVHLAKRSGQTHSSRPVGPGQSHGQPLV